MTTTLLLLLPFFLPSLGPSSDPQDRVPQSDLPPLMKKALDEVLSRKYIHALADAYIFASTQQPWSPLEALRYLLHRNASLSMERITSILGDYQSSLIEDPQFLVSEISSLDILQFTTVLHLLFAGRKEQTVLINIDFDVMKASLEDSPGGNRSLFAVAREKCVSALREGFCVDLMGTLLGLSNGEFVEEDFISDLPIDLSDNAFRNLTAVFKDLYDMFSVTTQKAIYKWITQGLQKTSKSSYSPDVWMTAENLWFLGRYMVHLAVQSIHRVSLSEMRIFIHYDNATKQLDSVYDIKSGPGKAFLHRINASGFDMTNVSTAYRLGLLVCFYDNVQLLDASDARSLLHQLIKCNQLRGSQTEVQKLKSQLLSLVIQNQTLNESLGSVSNAVVGLTPSQLESLSAQAVQKSMGVLQQVPGWTRSQAIILAHKYMGTNKTLSLSNISELGSLVSGLDASLFYSVNTAELAQAVESVLLRHITRLNPAQQHAIISQMLTAEDMEGVLSRIHGALFSEVPLSTLLKLTGLQSATLVDKHLTSSQAIFLYNYLSKSTPEADLMSNGQLLKGITCDRIHRMDKEFLIEYLPIFKRNFHLLSPFQMNCLAWRYWDALDTPNSNIPSILLLTLPVEYVDNMPNSSCKHFLYSLSNTDLDCLTVHAEKGKAVMRKVLQCLSEGIRDEYHVDLLGALLCHFPPEAIRAYLSPAAVPAALQQLRGCARLTPEQRASVRDKLLQFYGYWPRHKLPEAEIPVEWSAELTQDMGPLITLLSRDEILVLASKYPEEVLPLVVQAGRTPLPDDFLAAIFEVVCGAEHQNWSNADSETDCHLIRAPTADKIRKLSEANVFWSAEELQCISNDTFTQTVELLGSVQGYNLTQLMALKTRAKQAWGPLSTWRSYNVIDLGSIALALTEVDIKELNLSSVDTMSALSQQSSWTLQQMTSLLYRFLEASGLSLGKLRGSDLAGLGVLLCGVEPSQVHLISPEAYSSAAHRIGTLPCTLPVLKELKKIAERVFGVAGSWNSSVLQEVGVLAAGMSVEEIKKLHPDVMPYLKAQAIAAIPCKTFKEFSQEQLQSLGPENAKAVTSSQCAQLTNEQLWGLQAARDGLREGLSSHIHSAASLNLDTISVSSGVCLPLCGGLWVMAICSSIQIKW
ncbi:otoancorin-like [Anguilla anguilla]|uniref:otoancorin-like n=1 Tax=Anguilla anguilla TaxID=7936 RepID=UPI0015B32C94|nr:otoancorin-like [Anguilla anguilla]